MNYPYENLGPERFQQLCQAILVNENPNIICYPIGMPDGGRDASIKSYEDDKKISIVFQVKFSREGIKPQDAKKWLLNAAIGERSKVSKLKERGASQYVLITNAAGSSHLDSGSIDQVNTELSNTLGIVTTCWWRDDINRRLDNLWNIKLAYPEILVGQDLLRLALERNGGEAIERRVNAIKAFLQDQYQEDNEVKFKQVELQNKLLDLFVDLPYTLQISEEIFRANTAHIYRAAQHLNGIQRKKDYFFIENPKDDEHSGTASLILNQNSENLAPNLVIEGAPGQGKSTLAQYLCQVHRIRLLNIEGDLKQLPQAHQTAPIYLPFKIDLRDLAEWMSGTDPFAAQGAAREITEKTVEAFLARLVEFRSGGIRFDTNDLIEASKDRPIFLAFDGLDEVADIKRRAEVINAVTRSLSRIRENCPNLRSIITSRPAAFANSPGFDSKTFPYLQLGAVRRSQINRYAEKWMTARSLDNREQAEFRQILEEKLSLPHLRDLSRNPMQLTILLSLVHTKGAALPDKRTALYDAYVDLFFGRESAKNSVVRKNLELLKDIHRYLAWVLHSRAEDAKRSGADGRIATEELKETLREYLRSENHETHIIDDLFSVLLERVVMIVSRVEGTHEFEVQPLREYFAARYLYDTASYSPPGKERSGTKPDRFDAIAKNSYWLNVLRFYCGCYSKGELLDLAESVKGVENDAEIGRTRRMEMISEMLLQDWVFTQSPKALSEIVEELKTSDSIRRLSSIHYAFPHSEPVRLPSNGGGNAITLAAYKLLLDEKLPPGDASAIAQFIIENDTQENIKKRLERDIDEISPNQWINISAQLNSLTSTSEATLAKKIKDSTLRIGEIAALCIAGQQEVLKIDAKHAADAAMYMQLSVYPFKTQSPDSPLSLLSTIKDVFSGRHAYRRDNFQQDELTKKIEYIAGSPTPSNCDSNAISKLEFECHQLAKLVNDQVLALDENSRSDKTLSIVANTCMSVLGINPTTVMIGLSTCEHFGIRSGRPRNCYLYDYGAPIVERMRYFKTKSNDSEFIKKLINDTQTSAQAQLLFACILYWTNHNIAIEHKKDLCRLLELPNELEWQGICHAASFVSHLRKKTRLGKLESESIEEEISSERFAFLLAQMVDEKSTVAIFLKLSNKSLSHSIPFANFQIRTALRALRTKAIAWDQCADIIRQSTAYPVYVFPPEIRLSNEAIRDILKAPKTFPLAIWYVAQELAHSKGLSPVKTVASIARRDKWFAE